MQTHICRERIEGTCRTLFSSYLAVTVGCLRLGLGVEHVVHHRPQNRGLLYIIGLKIGGCPREEICSGVAFGGTEHEDHPLPLLLGPAASIPDHAATLTFMWVRQLLLLPLTAHCDWAMSPLGLAIFSTIAKDWLRNDSLSLSTFSFL